MDNRYNRHNRRKYSLKVPIVLVTKYRRQLLKGTIADDVKQKIFDICNSIARPENNAKKAVLQSANCKEQI